MRKTLSVIILLIGACLAAEDRPIILVSVPPYQSIVQEIAGNSICVQSIVPPNTNFHSFDPTPKRINELRHARLWYTIGEPFEYKIREALLRQKNPPILVDLRMELSLIEEGGGFDPHIWTSPSMMIRQLDTIRDGLVRVFPEMEEEITERYAFVRDCCLQLVAEADAYLSHQKGKILVIAHDAYAYLCRDYEIEQCSIESGGKEATVGSLDELIKKAQKRGVKKVFSVAQHSKQGITRIAQVLGATVVALDPSQLDYFAGEREAIRAFGNALEEET
jgi:zinc transport system substrate-binding protein